MKSDFAKGSVWKNIMSQALPLLFAQLVHLLYNVVDRIYIGHLPVIGSLALTGIGICFPITTLTSAFTNLFGSGGAPIFAIARGAHEEDRAENILGVVFMMLCVTSVVITGVSFAFRKPLLYMFGASDESYLYAEQYLNIYLWGTVASMVSTGLNGFINAQGYPVTGMLTICLGAVLNLVLDPLFIFVFDMEVAGAALATVISQFASFAWVMLFFFGKKTLYRIRLKYLVPKWEILRDMLGLGTANFVMGFTNTAVSTVCNVTLRAFGGDLYVGIMTVLNSVREILMIPASCIPGGAQHVLSFNYGAKKYSRVRQGIRFIAAFTVVYMIVAWVVTLMIPGLFMGIFTDDAAMIEAGTSCLTIYFFGFCFMALQMVGQTSFTAMKYAKHAIFFSLLRKAVIVVPLTLLLPRLGFGVNGVFMAEPISNVVGGLACGLTMYFTLYRRLPSVDE